MRENFIINIRVIDNREIVFNRIIVILIKSETFETRDILYLKFDYYILLIIIK